MLARNSFDERSNSQAEKASLLCIGLTRRSFRNVQINRRCRPSYLGLHVEAFTFWKISGNFINDFDIAERLLPHLQQLKLKRHRAPPGLVLSSIAHRLS